MNTRLLLPGTLEGIGRFSHEVLRRIVKNHPEDEFIFLFDRAFDDEFIYDKNVIGVDLSPQSRHPVLWYWWFEKSVSKALAQYRPDVFFSPELYCCLTTNVPTLMIAHDVAYAHFPHHIPFSHRNYLKYFVPRFLQKADKVGAVSHATIADLKDKFQVPQEKLFLSYNGPTPGFKPLSDEYKISVRKKVSGGRPYFVYLGSMHPRKNVDKMIRAFDHFRKDHPSSDHCLVLVGRLAWKSGKIKEAYELSPFKDDILRLGQREDANEILGAAEALLYVSLLEGFGIPILEAMQCDVPVITSNISSMPEVAGDAAILVSPLDVNAIAHAMKQVLDEKVKDDLIQKGEFRVREFSWESTSATVYHELEKMVH